MTTTYRVTLNGNLLADVRSEREARRVARRALGCARVSEHPTATGWGLYPTGDVREDGPTVYVEVR